MHNGAYFEQRNQKKTIGRTANRPPHHSNERCKLTFFFLNDRPANPLSTCNCSGLSPGELAIPHVLFPLLQAWAIDHPVKCFGALLSLRCALGGLCKQQQFVDHPTAAVDLILGNAPYQLSATAACALGSLCKQHQFIDRPPAVVDLIVGNVPYQSS